LYRSSKNGLNKDTIVLADNLNFRIS